MKMYKILIVSLVIVSASFAQDSVLKPPAKTLKVAAVLGLTGNAANHADGMRKGLEMAGEKLRSDGWNLELVYEDDQTNAGKTVSAIQSLLSKGHRLFIGPTWSFQINAARPVLEVGKAIAFVPGGSSDTSGGSSRGVFYMSQNRMSQVQPISDWLKSRGFRKACILTAAGDWGELHRKIYETACKNAGVSIVCNDTFNYGENRLFHRAMLAKAKQKEPDLIMTTTAVGDIANLINARSDLHMQAVIFGTDTLPEAIEQKLVRPENAYSLVMIRDSSRPVFREEYTRRWHEKPKSYSDTAYDSLMILAKAVEQGDGSNEAINSFLLEKLDYSGMSGRIRFDDAGDIKDGTFEIVEVSP